MKRLLLAALMMVACGDSPTEPGSNSLTGSWTATQVDLWHNVTVELIEHSADNITGTWTAQLRCSHRVSGFCGPRSGIVVAGSRDAHGIIFTMNGPRDDHFDTGCGYGNYIIEGTRDRARIQARASLTDYCPGNTELTGQSFAVSFSR